MYLVFALEHFRREGIWEYCRKNKHEAVLQVHGSLTEAHLSYF